MKSIRKQGFTIVELLVVIVVIGILAAITVVSYTGITTKANTATNQQNASSVQSAVATKYAETNAWQAWSTDSAGTITALNLNGVSKIPSTIVLQNSAATAGSNIGYTVVTNGVCISYWDYSGTAAAHYLGVGTVTIPTTGLSCA